MKFRYCFKVNAPLKAVTDFHRRSASMAAITPPPVMVKLHAAPPRLAEGDEMDFTLWLGPLPIRWQARIEEVSETGFVDRQLDGPFGRWDHRHTFKLVDETTTLVIDEIEFELARSPFKAAIGLGMGLTLPLLFAYRGWKTRRFLKNSQFQTTQPAIPENSNVYR